MWVDSNYCWVVVCKNHWFHGRGNFFSVHRIPLGETDAVLPRPDIDKPFLVRCDECGKEYTYTPSDVLKYEMEAPAPFVAQDRKSTRLNSSHGYISYAVFCLKKKTLPICH